MRQHPSTSEHLRCACGCGQHVRRGQRWAEPACKARAYRARQRDTAEDQEHAALTQALQVAALTRKVEALECAYIQLWEEHQDCPRTWPVEDPRPSGSWPAFDVLGVRADAEPEAVEGAYRALAKKYHPDRCRGDPTSEARMKALTAAYAEVKRVMMARTTAAASGERRRGFTPP